MAQGIDVVLEVGEKKTFASAVDWPGWCRSGKDAEGALQALAAYGSRYAQAIGSARQKFVAPDDASAFTVTERLPGNATTDFGAPGVVAKADARPFDDEQLKRSRAILRACWRAFDKAIAAAQGKELRKGPRGGGRDVEKIAWHVIDSDKGYLGAVAQKFKRDEGTDYAYEFDRIRAAMEQALEAGARGDIPEEGPRGGKVWPLRYYVRRTAWHVLDHTWEIEDRIR